MELHWLDPDHPDARDVAGAVAVLEAARMVDNPPRPAGDTVSIFTARLRHGSDGDPPVAAVAREPEHGRVTGVLRVDLPRWDNPNLAEVFVVVDPRERRRGLGRRLFEAGLDRVREQGRRLVSSFCMAQTAGVEFLKAMGLDPALEIAFRRQDVPAVDWARLDREDAAARSHAAGYELVRFAGPTPEESLAGIAGVAGAINDAPTGALEIEDERFPPERIRAWEAAMAARGERLYRVVARERETGELAGHTVVTVESERPWLGGQGDTSVLGAHRGHRLGLLLKVDMLRWLREVEPQLRTIDTGNAASNAHMIRVNEALGYEEVARGFDWQRHL